MKFKRIFLESYDKKEALKRIEQHYDDCANKYFSEYKKSFEKPSFKIKTMPNKAGLYGVKENTIYINPDITMDDQLLKSIVYHETIHAFEGKVFQFDRMYDPHTCRHFQDYMKKMNAIEGENFINIKQDAMGMKDSAKTFHVYFIETTKNEIYFIWSNKELDRLKDVIRRMSKLSFPGIPFYAECKEAVLKSTSPATEKTNRFAFAVAGEKGTEQEKLAYSILKNHKDKKQL